MNDNFEVKILDDGKIQITSTGGFRKEIHQDADEFLSHIQELAGGSHNKRKLPRTLANPHQTQTSQQHHHH